MSKRERKQLKSNLIIVLRHLLKWHYQAADETGLSLKRFPLTCPYTTQSTLDPNYLPKSGDEGDEE